MSAFLFPPQAPISLPVVGTEARFPVGRIFCVGRNYADHAAEMGAEVDREAPFFFLKSPHALAESGGDIPYAPATSDLHHEIEFVVALGADAFRIDASAAMDTVFGYGCGLDMTRRDLQARSKEKRLSWDTGKDFENAAILTALTTKDDFGAIADQRIHLKVNGEDRQQGDLSQMIWSVPELIADLSRMYHLRAGDLIMTGTPAGVGPVQPGDILRGGVESLTPLEVTITAPE